MGGETNSEHAQTFTKTNPSLWLHLSPRFHNETCSSNCLSPQNCKASSRTRFLWIACSCSYLSEENCRSSFPRVANFCNLATHSLAFFRYLCTLPLLAILSAHHAMRHTDTRRDRLQPNRLVQKVVSIWLLGLSLWL